MALVSEPIREAARSLLGLAGYCIGMFRPDGALAYAALGQQVASNFTGYAWRSALQLAAYLTSTADMALTFRRSGKPAVGYADSSSMNGGAGQSWGGYAIGRPGSGLTSFRCLSPRHLSDSSGGNELIVATLLLKERIGERIASAELGLLPPGKATILFMDASAVLSGVAMDRVSRESRYLATRLAMLRQAVSDGVVAMRKIDTSVNPADIFTKPVVGAALHRLRALVLGLDWPAPVTAPVAENMVMVLKEKVDPGGAPTKRSRRFTIADVTAPVTGTTTAANDHAPSSGAGSGGDRVGGPGATEDLAAVGLPTTGSAVASFADRRDLPRL